MVRWPIRAHSSSVRRASRSTSKIPRFRYSGRGRPTGRAILGVLRRAALLRTRLCVIREATMFSSVSFVYPGASSRCRMFSSDCASTRKLRARWLAVNGDRSNKLKTGRSERIALREWQRVRDHLSAVSRSELPLRDEVSLLSALAVQACRRRERLRREAARASRGLLHI
jgi:hypothetical protein